MQPKSDSKDLFKHRPERKNLKVERQSGASQSDRWRWRNASLMVLTILCACLTSRLGSFLSASEKITKRYAVCVSQGSIYTSEGDNPFVECISVRGSIIDFLGTRKDLESHQPQPGWLERAQAWLPTSHFAFADRPIVYTLDGQGSVLPGFIDAHAHPLEHGPAALGVDLTGCKSVESVVDRIINHLGPQSDLATDTSQIIRGSGWDQSLFEGRQFPTAAALSSNPILKERKIVLKRIDYHAYWVSIAVLDSVLAGKPDLDVEGGEIVKDQDGRPTGVFLDSAMELIERILPKRTNEERLASLESAAKEMLSFGVTSVHDAATDLETIDFYKHLDAQDSLPIRVTAMADCGFTYCGDQVQKYIGNKFILRSVKLFVDGALGSWGAALWAPYSDKNSSRGILRAPVETLVPLIQKWVDAGFQVNSHAIGDRANTIVLDAYEKVLSRFNGSSHHKASFNFPRLRIEHAQILQSTDIERMGQMNIIASVQPTHAIADMDYAEARLGHERIRGAYAWNSLLKHNVTMAMGSDFPVSGVSPFLGIHAAYTRRKPSGDGDDTQTNQAWYPEERIEELQEIVKGFTLHASFAGFHEDQTGSLRVGKRADFVLVNRNLFDPAKSRNQISAQILGLSVLATVFNGRVVYGQI